VSTLRQRAAALATMILGDRVADLARNITEACNKSGLPNIGMFSATLAVAIQAAKAHGMDRERFLWLVTEMWDQRE